MKLLLSLFFIVHGLIHLSFISPKPPVKEGAPAWPFDISKSPWLPVPSGLAHTLGVILTVVATVGFVLVGLGLLGVIPFAWIKIIAIISSLASIILIGIFWHNWFVVGMFLSLLILYWFLVKVV